MTYSVVSEQSSDKLVDAVNEILEELGKELRSMHLSGANGKHRIMFTVDATHNEHKAMMDRLRRSADLSDFEAIPDRETD
jgi:hypothetical protein